MSVLEPEDRELILKRLLPSSESGDAGDVLTLDEAKKPGWSPGAAGGPWGEAGTAKFSGSGSPVGVVTPTGEGDLYVDNTTPALWQATGATSSDWQQVGAGGSQPITRELLSGSAVLITNGNAAALTWDSADSGDALLDLTDPSAPVIVTAGTYAVTAMIAVLAAMTAAGVYQAQLEMDADGEDASAFATIGAASGVGGQPSLFIACTYYIPAGGKIVLTVSNRDGVKDLNFLLGAAVVQRLA